MSLKVLIVTLYAPIVPALICEQGNVVFNVLFGKTEDAVRFLHIHRLLEEKLLFVHNAP